MESIKELMPGDTFVVDNDIFVLTTDFKKNNDRLAINLVSGISRWFNDVTECKKIFIYKIDESSNAFAQIKN